MAQPCLDLADFGTCTLNAPRERVAQRVERARPEAPLADGSDGAQW